MDSKIINIGLKNHQVLDHSKWDEMEKKVIAEIQMEEELEKEKRLRQHTADCANIKDMEELEEELSRFKYITPDQRLERLQIILNIGWVKYRDAKPYHYFQLLPYTILK